MSESNFNPGHDDRLVDFVGRDNVKNCIGGIVSKRERLRELRFVGREASNRENLEEEFNGLLHEIDDLVGDLQSAIEQDDLDLSARQKNFPAIYDDRWSLGTEELRGPLMPFLRGNLEPIRSVVVAPDLPEGVFALFLSIPGLKELLKREIHGHWGYHYHYLDAKERRSDTLLTFDRQLKTLPGGQQVKVVTWERHGETSHFAARAATWGAKKRESVYEACLGDSAKRNLNDFKKPAKDAEALWPI
ncbi:hypothetical protein QO034_22330 [Sedimentitalea sp. JM2-8]|uniref:Uncharacterized protein n=1 Tax=Sedimentitalea xiamensis TaxID=3050037 RepID=A0ABT7FKV1_9RHOB|nr:hypothetical protein [Sedimentitalea xiamensis]MDK3075796.1 hypothetical protein [Sedimentitalea xiamensis]